MELGIVGIVGEEEYKGRIEGQKRESRRIVVRLSTL